MFLSWVFYLAVFLRFSYGFWGRGELAEGYAQTSFQIRTQRIFGAVPLGSQKNALEERGHLFERKRVVSTLLRL